MAAHSSSDFAPRYVCPTCALLLTGAAFVGLGAWRGEAETVLRKAITICMECIGLG